MWEFFNHTLSFMNSPFANLFLAIQQRLESTVTDVTYIDQDMGQLKNNDKPFFRPPVSWPCVLIDFEDFQFQNMSENVQNTEGTVVLKLGFAPFSSSGQATPDTYKEKAISYYDTEWNLNKALHGWSPGDDFGYLTRSSAITEKRYDNIRVREIRYRIAFEDYSAGDVIQYISAAVKVEPEIEIP